MLGSMYLLSFVWRKYTRSWLLISSFGFSREKFSCYSNFQALFGIFSLISS